MAEKQTTEKQSTFKELVLPVIVLVVICLVCSALLAVLNDITAPIIAENTQAEITMLEQTRTNVMARPMPTAPETVVVTASAEQQPSTRRRTGFSRMMPAVKTFHLLGFSFIVTAPP